MIIELQGYRFEIIPSETVAAIRIRTHKDGTIQVLAHPQLPKKELLAYLNEYLPKAKEKRKKVPVQDENNKTIRLFDDSYYIRIDTNIQTPFIREKSIHTASLPTKEKEINLLKERLLYSQIMGWISFWEETLDFLLDEVVLKKLPTNYFIVHKEKSQVVFSKKTADLSLDMLYFVVATSIFKYLELSDNQTEQLFSQYVQNWKHLSRIFEHELAYKR